MNLERQANPAAKALPPEACDAIVYLPRAMATRPRPMGCCSQKLMPWIAEHYAVRTDCIHSGMDGSSRGGLVSLYLGLRQALYFGKLALLSPSVWWNRKSILSTLNEQAPRVWVKPRIWLDVGGSKGRKTQGDAEQLARCVRPIAGARARTCTSSAPAAARAARQARRRKCGRCYVFCFQRIEIEGSARTKLF